MRRLPTGRTLHLATLTAICALAGAAAAQDMPATQGPPPAAAAAPIPTPTPPAVEQQNAAAAPQAMAPLPGPATPAAHPLGKAQLEQILAPIALYPDPLLSQVLMASTYPLEIVEADRWVRVPANAALKDGALTDALKQQNWDPSVKALVPFPKLLSLLADKLEWTEALGNAFLAQQADVMDAVQALRHSAMQAGNLKVTPQCHCVIQTSGEMISILPSDSSQVCIPVYNPRVAYGPWPWPDYQPDYFPEQAGFAFEPGFAVGYWPVIEVAAFGPLWGWAWFDWGHHDVTVDRGRFTAVGGRAAFAGNNWVHDPGHRGGVGYRDPAVTGRFGAARTAAVTAGAAAGRGSVGRGGVASTGAAATRFGGARQPGGGRSAGRFGGTAAAAGRMGGHVGHASFAGARAGGGAHFGGGSHGGGHFGGGGGGHAAHAQFAPRGGGGGPHFGGGGAHFAGGGGPHGGGGGGGHGGGGGGGHGGGGHH
jgi:hypothetical protein